MTTANRTAEAIKITKLAYIAAKEAGDNWADLVDAALGSIGIDTADQAAYDDYEDDGETIVILADGTRITTHDIV